MKCARDWVLWSATKQPQFKSTYHRTERLSFVGLSKTDTDVCVIITPSWILKWLELSTPYAASQFHALCPTSLLHSMAPIANRMIVLVMDGTAHMYLSMICIAEMISLKEKIKIKKYIYIYLSTMHRWGRRCIERKAPIASHPLVSFKLQSF